MENTANFEKVIALAKQLSLLDKVRLIERIAPEIERDLKASKAAARRSLRGLWRGLDLTEDTISEARREVWAELPREDI